MKIISQIWLISFLAAALAVGMVAAPQGNSDKNKKQQTKTEKDKSADQDKNKDNKNKPTQTPATGDRLEPDDTARTATDGVISCGDGNDIMAGRWVTQHQRRALYG